VTEFQLKQFMLSSPWGLPDVEPSLRLPEIWRVPPRLIFPLAFRPVGSVEGYREEEEKSLRDGPQITINHHRALGAYPHGRPSGSLHRRASSAVHSASSTVAAAPFLGKFFDLLNLQTHALFPGDKGAFRVGLCVFTEFFSPAVVGKESHNPVRKHM